MAKEDAELLTAIAAGDPVAFAEFYDRHSPAVYGLLVTILRGHGDAEDALQETFLQVWRQAGRYDSEQSSPFGWVVMMARSRAVDRLRRRTDSVTSELPERPVLSETGANVEREEVAGRVREALGQLPPDQRGAINLAFYGGLTYEQVAVREQIPVGTAKTRIRLGLQKLRRLLNATEGNWSD